MTRPTCPKCGKRKVEKQYGKQSGTFRRICGLCRRPNRPAFGTTRYKRKKITHCELCGFKAVDPCQLDVDHRDGNHNNNDPSNLQTLCANCHRLKTKLHSDGIYKHTST